MANSSEAMYNLGLARSQWGSGGGLTNAIMDLGLGGPNVMNGVDDEEERRKKRRSSLSDVNSDLYPATSELFGKSWGIVPDRGY